MLDQKKTPKSEAEQTIVEFKKSASADPVSISETAKPETPYDRLDRISHAGVASATSGIAPSVLA